MNDEMPQSNLDSPPDEISLFQKMDTEDYLERFDRKKLMLGLPRHLLAIVLISIFFCALGSYFTYYFLNIYQAEAQVIFQENLNQKLPNGANLTSFTLPTVLDMIKLPSNFEAVKTILSLDLSVKELEKMVDIPTPHANSNLIEILSKGNNPNLVVDIANTLAKVAVKNSRDFARQELQTALENFKLQLEVVRKRMASQNQDIEDFKKAHHYFEMTPNYSSMLGQITDIKSKVQSADLQYNQLFVEYENLKHDVENLPENVETPYQDKGGVLQTRIAALQSALAEARAKYSSNNPKLKALQDELNDLLSQKQTGSEESNPIQEKNPVKEKLQIELMRMQSKVRAAQKTKQELALLKEEMEKELQDLPSQQVSFAKLLQAEQITEFQFKFLSNAVETTQLMLNVPKGSIELYLLADRAKPYKDAWWVKILPLLGLFFGLGLGIFIAYFLEILDSKFRTAKQVELTYTIPCIQVIPELSSFYPHNAEEKTRFFIRNLAERLEQIAREKSFDKKKCLSIAFVSALAGEGKSCLACNLARYYERLNHKTLLLEFDYRSNPFADDIPNEKFAENYFDGKAALNDIIVRGKPDRIRLGAHDPFLKEILKSEAMQQLWKTANKDYQIVIIDAPGVIDDHYSTNLAALADMRVFIIDSSDVNKNLVDQGLQELEILNARPCGIILNRVLPFYIEDERIRIETKRDGKSLLDKWMFWKD